jgi:hypothetical protein
MIVLWENKNIGEKKYLWIYNITGIRMDEPVFMKIQGRMPTPVPGFCKTRAG